MSKIMDAFPAVAATAAATAILSGCGGAEVTIIPTPAPVRHYENNQARNLRIDKMADQFAGMLERQAKLSGKDVLGRVTTTCYASSENPSIIPVKVPEASTKPGDFCQVDASKSPLEWSYENFNVDVPGHYDPKSISGFMAANYAGCTVEFSHDASEGSGNTLEWDVIDWDLTAPGSGGPGHGEPASTSGSNTVSEAYNIDQASFACMRATNIVLSLEQAG